VLWKPLSLLLRDEDWELAEDEILPEKLKRLCGLVGFWDIVGRLSDPTDLLTRWEKCVPLLELDGVCRLRVPREEKCEEGGKYPVAMLADQEYRVLKFEEYVTVIEATLGERALEEGRGTIAFPEELRILSELGVDGLLGAGLENCRSWWGIAFWFGPGEEPIEKVVSRVGGPDDNIQGLCLTLRAISSLEEGWVVAGGWDTGYAHDAEFCCAVFCRRADEEDAEFAWRYTRTCESDARVFSIRSRSCLTILRTSARVMRIAVLTFKLTRNVCVFDGRSDLGSVIYRRQNHLIKY
jgi:hypothetical protein